MTVEKIEYGQSLENNQQLFAIYYPSGMDVNNQRIEAEVILYAEFSENQIVRMHGQIRLIQGDAKSVDMVD